MGRKTLTNRGYSDVVDVAPDVLEASWKFADLHVSKLKALRIEAIERRDDLTMRALTYLITLDSIKRGL